MAQSLLSWGALVLYTTACFVAVSYLINKSERARRTMLSLLGTGLTLHLFAWAARLVAFWGIPENRWYLPVNSFFGALSYMALALAAAFFFIEARKKLGILGAFILPFVAGSLGLAVLKASPAMPARVIAPLVPVNVTCTLLAAASTSAIEIWLPLPEENTSAAGLAWNQPAIT